MYRELPYLGPCPVGSTSRLARGLLAGLLSQASVVLARMSVGVAGAAAQPRVHEPVVEFHGEAGAPEGALYVDGVLVGTLMGVSRL